MREFLFRGKTEKGEWVYGAYYKQREFYGDEVDIDCIITTKDVLSNDLWLFYEEVIPETVGQYVGITDKNGKKVYEGDLVAFELYNKMICVGVIVYWEEKAMFVVSTKIGATSFMDSRLDNIEVIGNAHDNPELLEGKE